jgi:hypothetical protein
LLSIWTPVFTALGLLYLVWLAVGSLPAPALLAPADRVALAQSGTLDQATMSWSATPGALRYVVELQSCDPAGCDRATFPMNPPTLRTSETSYFLGMPPGGAAGWRWRVWAVNAVGRESAKSDWREFQFAR